jgi:hypothetical protein
VSGADVLRAWGASGTKYLAQVDFLDSNGKAQGTPQKYTAVIIA